MGDKSVRVNLWFHTDNEKEALAYEYISEAKKAGKSFTEYITDCVLEHEEGERISVRTRNLDALAEMIAEKIRGSAGNKRMGI